MNIIGNWDVIHCYNHHYWFSYRILCVLIVIYVMGIYIYIHIFIHIYYSHCLNSYKSILLTFLSAMNKLLKKTLISLHDYFYLYHSFNFRKLRDLKVRIHLPVIYYFHLKRRIFFFFFQFAFFVWLIPSVFVKSSLTSAMSMALKKGKIFFPLFLMH